jgi:hypothetical protein
MIEQTIVLGAPRSGTTFLMGFLDALPRAECVSGNLLPVGIAHLAAQQLPDEARDALRRSFRCSLVDYLESGAYNSRAGALQKWWAADRRARALRAAARGVRNENLLVYKEPFLAFAPELACDALPQARIVHIFRDGRDVADSLVRSYDVLSDAKLAGLDSNEVMIGTRIGDRYLPWWVGEEDAQEFFDAAPYVRAIWMWREMVGRCRERLQRPDVAASGRVLSVRYEDLMRAPLQQGEAIARHLGRSLTERMRRRLQAAHTRSVGIHKRRERHEITAAERVAGSELAAYGYMSERSPLAAAPSAG